MGCRVDSVSTIIPSHSQVPVGVPLREVIERREEGAEDAKLRPVIASVRYSPEVKVLSSSLASRASSRCSGMSTCSSSHHHDSAPQKSLGPGPFSPIRRPKRNSVARRTSAAPTTSRRRTPGLEGQPWNGVVRAIVCAWFIDRIDAVLGPRCPTLPYLTISAVRRVRPLAYFAG